MTSRSRVYIKSSLYVLVPLVQESVLQATKRKNIDINRATKSLTCNLPRRQDMVGQ